MKIIHKKDWDALRTPVPHIKLFYLFLYFLILKRN